jgi:hypothetical protein
MELENASSDTLTLFLVPGHCSRFVSAAHAVFRTDFIEKRRKWRPINARK